jgi:hypothetical protein
MDSHRRKMDRHNRTIPATAHAAARRRSRCPIQKRADYRLGPARLPEDKPKLPNLMPRGSVSLRACPIRRALMLLLNQHQTSRKCMANTESPSPNVVSPDHNSLDLVFQICPQSACSLRSDRWGGQPPSIFENQPRDHLPVINSFIWNILPLSPLNSKIWRERFRQSIDSKRSSEKVGGEGAGFDSKGLSSKILQNKELKPIRLMPCFRSSWESVTAGTLNHTAQSGSPQLGPDGQDPAAYSIL